MSKYQTKDQGPADPKAADPKAADPKAPAGTPDDPLPVVATADPRYGNPPIYYLTCPHCHRTFGTHALGLDRCMCGFYLDKQEAPKAAEEGK